MLHLYNIRYLFKLSYNNINLILILILVTRIILNSKYLTNNIQWFCDRCYLDVMLDYISVNKVDWSTMGSFSIGILNIDKANRNISFGYSYKMQFKKEMWIKFLEIYNGHLFFYFYFFCSRTFLDYYMLCKFL
jgi:hypothetical protein